MAQRSDQPSKEIRERVARLRKEIEHHRYLYHVLDRSVLSDAALDSLKRELDALERQYPSLITPDSPTQRVGGKARSEFAKVNHAVPMLSLNDAFSEDEFRSWIARIEKVIPRVTRKGFYVELKIDGLAIALEYEDGLFVVGSTRGDGFVGEDVTANLKTIEAIPLRLRTREEVAADLVRRGFSALARRLPNPFPHRIEVRGEAFLSKEEFSRINRELERRGEKTYANPRNLAAGSIRQLDPKVTARRKLDSFAYELITDLGQEMHEEVHALLSALGFKTNRHNERVSTPDEVIAFRNRWERKREELPYEIDGIVVIVNDLSIFQRLGVVGKAPRGAIAYKFALREATTVVREIRVQVGRTGALTPVAVLDPVAVGGVTITHATLHNADEVRRLDVRVGDTVIVGRAGDVIPQIRGVVKGLRPRGTKPFTMPRRCPSCGTAVVRSSSEGAEGVIIRCPNVRCPGRHREHLYHFVGKSAFDIIGLGPETIDKLVDGGFVRDVADFFTLTRDDLTTLEGFGDVSAEKLLAAIASRKRIELPRFLVGLGIPHVGEETALALARHFPSLGKLANASEEALRRLPDIGPVVASAIFQWFRNPQNRRLLRKLENVGVRPIPLPGKARGAQPLKGKTIVFTGELSSMTREGAKRLAREAGADVSESVSRKTSFVVMGDRPGSKAEKAKTLGVPIIGEREFLKLIGK